MWIGGIRSDGDEFGGGLAYYGGRLFVTTGFAMVYSLDPATGVPVYSLDQNSNVVQPLTNPLDPSGLRPFFTDAEIINLDSVKTQDMELFRKLFWAMLDRGIYIAPSPYETGFLSLAHTHDDIDVTLDALEQSVAEL